MHFPTGFSKIVFTSFINIATGIITYFLTKDFITAFIAVGITILLILLFYNSYIYYNLIKKSGLKRIYDDKPDPTPMLKHLFKKSKQIRLLAIRGARMLGSDRSLINYISKELPRSWEGSIQILLLDPESTHLENRANELGHDPTQFAIECKSAIQNIYKLNNRYNLNVEVRLYDRKPILRAIIFDSCALLSYYIGSDGHIPIQYKIEEGNNSLLRMMNLIYNDLWSEAKST